ncbi:hypothetical protein QFC21_002549 [Naganishia friedmannii]|uniref:Uncharacterized protein n=1 Tax=Naganishia friedmannii TaxID=89922 RepID=A0ACC2VXH8_9TREE|nr:hypothetical protein QFC21_002549 [Naganishia friedmannii]
MSSQGQQIASVVEDIASDESELKRPPEWIAPTSWDLQEFDTLLKYAFSITCTLNRIFVGKQGQAVQDRVSAENLDGLAGIQETWKLVTRPLQDINFALTQAIIESALGPLQTFQQSILDTGVRLQLLMPSVVSKVQSKLITPYNIQAQLELFRGSVSRALEQVQFTLLLQFLRRRLWRLNSVMRIDPDRIQEECSLFPEQVAEDEEVMAYEHEGASERLTLQECQTVASDPLQLASAYTRKTRGRRRRERLEGSHAELFVKDTLQFTGRHLKKQAERESAKPSSIPDLSLNSHSLLEEHSGISNDARMIRCLSVLPRAETCLTVSQWIAHAETREHLGEILAAYLGVIFPLLKEGLREDASIDASSHGGNTDEHSSGLGSMAATVGG